MNIQPEQAVGSLVASSGQDGVVNELKLGHGIYYTDYRKQPTVTESKNCQNFLNNSQPKEKEISNNPEILVADFKEIQNKIEKLEYSIREIEAVENFEKHEEFTSAIEEDYVVILKNLASQISILQQIEKIDYKNSFFENYSIKDIRAKIENVTYKQADFKEKHLKKASVFI